MNYTKRLIVFLIMAVLGCTSVPKDASAAGPNNCQFLFVPMDLGAFGIPDAQVYGELCLPDGPTPKTVQFLVHGSTFNHNYWDWPVEPMMYSHVNAALNAGYATFNIDRLGSGWSSLPPSFLVGLDVTIESLHQMIDHLHNGTLGPAFDNVVYFGSSLSTVYGWVLAERHPADMAGFVLTGLMHFTRPTFFQNVQLYHLDPACTDPKWSRFTDDCGYITTTPDKRDVFFWELDNSSVANRVVDELLKDIVSERLVFESAVYVLGQPDPMTAPSRTITVPTLIVMGEFDATACGGDDGLVCNADSVRAFEAPFYRDDIQLDAYVAPNTGHALTLHYTAPETVNFENMWIDAFVGK